MTYGEYVWRAVSLERELLDLSIITGIPFEKLVTLANEKNRVVLEEMLDTVDDMRLYVLAHGTLEGFRERTK